MLCLMYFETSDLDFLSNLKLKANAAEPQN